MSFRFCPTLESRDGLFEKINLIPTDDFMFYRCDENVAKPLVVSAGKIKDTLWYGSRDSLRVCRDLKINDPNYLYGKDGVACKGAELGVYIFWKNQETSMAGCILPREGSEKKDESGWSMYFEHTFLPGEIKGNIDFSIVLYLKKAATEIEEDEKILNNTAGTVLGELGSYRLQVTDETIPFPFVIDNYDTDALWWVDFFSWDDPAEDAQFGPSSFVVHLNSKRKGCPKITEKGTLQNPEMMFEITAGVYALLYKRLDYQQFMDMQLGKGKPGTISAELKRVYELCPEADKIDYQDEYEKIHKTMQAVIKRTVSKVADLAEVTNE